MALITSGCNNCPFSYMNSVLQTLFCLPDFKSYYVDPYDELKDKTADPTVDLRFQSPPARDFCHSAAVEVSVLGQGCEALVTRYGDLVIVAQP